MKYFVGTVLIVELIIIVLLLARNRVAERLTTEVIRGQLVAETAKLNIFRQKLDSGESELVKSIMQSTVSNNIAVLQSGTYGDLDQEQREALKTVLNQPQPTCSMKSTEQ
jgi:hypothetical protein